MANRTTNIIKETADYFIANTTGGYIRLGLLGIASIDFPAGHAVYDAVAALADIEDDDAFNDAAEDLFYDNRFAAEG